MGVRDLTSLVRYPYLQPLLPLISTFFVIEIAFVGKAPGQYSMLLGGGYHGQRLNKIYRGWYLAPSFII